jgi:hypothetical protein
MIASQIVSTQRVIVGNIPARYIETAPGFTGEATLFGADFWGNPYYGIEIGGGTLNLQSGHFDNPGGQRLAQIDPAKTGKLRVFGSSVNTRSTRPINENVENHWAVWSSIIDPGNMTIANCENYLNNLTINPVLVFKNQITRTGWIATASKDNANARNALDGNVSTRWASGANKEIGDWFSVNMLKPQTFNKILLDQASSAGDYPRGYEVYLSDNGRNWGEVVVEGAGISGMTVITLPEPRTAQYVRIVLTAGAGGSYWSIHEYYIALMESGTIDYPSLLEKVKIPETQIYYAGGRLFAAGLSDNTPINIYTAFGQLIKSVKNNAAGTSLALPSEIYIVVAEDAGILCSQKLLVK